MRSIERVYQKKGMGLLFSFETNVCVTSPSDL